MIEIALSQDDRGTDHAAAEWEGREYQHTSRAGAVFGLARLLVAAGCPDGPWRVTGRMHGPSLHGIAKLTVDDRLRFAKWHPYSGPVRD